MAMKAQSAWLHVDSSLVLSLERILHLNNEQYNKVAPKQVC